MVCAMAELPLVGIIMGSDSDLEVMSSAAELLDEFAVPYGLTIVSAHRTPERLFSYAREAAERGLEVIIAGAGGAAHLPGMVASLCELPVIGVPVRTSALNGVDSLYSVVQMPPGVPVATVAINGARNAGLLAVQILGIKRSALQEKMRIFKADTGKMVEKKAAKLEDIGYQAYLTGEFGGKKHD